MSARVELVFEAFDGAGRLAAFDAGLTGEGAVVSFTGHARPTGQGGAALDALVLETHPGVTLASMQAIADAALARFAISRCTVTHRAGRILPGEAIVFVAAAARHRREAFDAAGYLMDRLKTEAVFWKREEGPGGRTWIEPRDDDHAAAQRWSEG